MKIELNLNFSHLFTINIKQAWGTKFFLPIHLIMLEIIIRSRYMIISFLFNIVNVVAKSDGLFRCIIVVSTVVKSCFKQLSRGIYKRGIKFNH